MLLVPQPAFVLAVVAAQVFACFRQDAGLAAGAARPLPGHQPHRGQQARRLHRAQLEPLQRRVSPQHRGSLQKPWLSDHRQGAAAQACSDDRPQWRRW